jgi:hypothetical protein
MEYAKKHCLAILSVLLTFSALRGPVPDWSTCASRIASRAMLEHFSCKCGVFEVVQGGFFLRKKPLGSRGFPL